MMALQGLDGVEKLPLHFYLCNICGQILSGPAADIIHVVEFTAAMAVMVCGIGWQLCMPSEHPVTASAGKLAVGVCYGQKRERSGQDRH